MRTPYNVIDLDVRPYLQKKLEPFEVIMNTVKELQKEDWLRLHATFKPTPLLGVMRVKGYVNKVEKLEADHWVVTFAPKKYAKALNSEDEPINTDDSDRPNEPSQAKLSSETSPQLNAAPTTYELDNRGLEPPQPMIRTLGQLDKARSGDVVIIHNDRVPVFLVEELNQLGYTYDISEQADGSAKVRITKS